MTGETRTCEECGESFRQRKDTAGRFCSRPCSSAGMRRKPQTCPSCGTSFRPLHGKTRVYCSARCAADARVGSGAPLPFRTCEREGCENTFQLKRPGDPKRFCSRECGKLGQARHGQGKRGMCKRGLHPLTPDNVREAQRPDGSTERRCAVCRAVARGGRPSRRPAAPRVRHPGRAVLRAHRSRVAYLLARGWSRERIAHRYDVGTADVEWFARHCRPDVVRCGKALAARAARLAPKPVWRPNAPGW